MNPTTGPIHELFGTVTQYHLLVIGTFAAFACYHLLTVIFGWHLVSFAVGLVVGPLIGLSLYGLRVYHSRYPLGWQEFFEHDYTHEAEQPLRMLVIFSVWFLPPLVMMAMIIGVAITAQAAVGVTQFISRDGLFAVFIVFLVLCVWLALGYWVRDLYYNVPALYEFVDRVYGVVSEHMNRIFYSFLNLVSGSAGLSLSFYWILTSCPWANYM
ncbi:hypothetical protein EIP91_010171 [Steccherinum ochraceum]|uniref:Uncharacterized protein n=1 Tax=Steccherinum ochraceum TaxID=92696 RepID=A0A4R0RX11_9APHY|nr:hypothetical protein EIP91_010171 [Steccherinum ochraceum]